MDLNPYGPIFETPELLSRVMEHVPEDRRHMLSQIDRRSYHANADLSERDKTYTFQYDEDAPTMRREVRVRFAIKRSQKNPNNVRTPNGHSYPFLDLPSDSMLQFIRACRSAKVKELIVELNDVFLNPRWCIPVEHIEALISLQTLDTVTITGDRVLYPPVFWPFNPNYPDAKPPGHDAKPTVFAKVLRIRAKEFASSKRDWIAPNLQLLEMIEEGEHIVPVKLQKAVAVIAYCNVDVKSLGDIAPYAKQLEIPYADLDEENMRGLIRQLSATAKFSFGGIPRTMKINTLALPAQSMTPANLELLSNMHTLRELMLYSDKGCPDLLPLFGGEQKLSIGGEQKLSILAVYTARPLSMPELDAIFRVHGQHLHKLEFTTSRKYEPTGEEADNPYVQLREWEVVIGDAADRRDDMNREFSMNVHLFSEVTLDIMLNWRTLW